MLTGDRTAKVLDFGLAKLTERFSDKAQTQITQTALTEAGMILGTVAYMSPEQASGQPVDQRTDIFSLGVTLYEMLAGRLPFRGKSQTETMSAILRDEPPTLAEPPELGEILAKALAKDPKERYQHCGDFALDLRRFERAWKEKRLPSMAGGTAAPGRKKLAWGLAWGVAALLIAGLAALNLARRKAEAWENPLENAQFTRLTDYDGSELDAALSPDGKFVVFLSDRDGPFDAFVGQVDAGNFVNITKGRFPELFHEQTRSVGFSGDGSNVWLRVSATDPTSKTVASIAHGIWLMPTERPAIFWRGGTSLFGRRMVRRLSTSNRFPAIRFSWQTARERIHGGFMPRARASTRITNRGHPMANTFISLAAFAQRRWMSGGSNPLEETRNASPITIPK